MFYKLPLLAMALLLCATGAQAKVTGHYRATLESHNEGGRWSDLNLALLGWRCHGSQEIRYYEPMLDHKGRMKEVEQKAASNQTDSIFMMNNPVVTTFKRDMAIEDPRLRMEVRENCSKTEYYIEREQYTEQDRNGNNHTRYRDVKKSRTRNAWMSWACDTSDLPRREKASRRSYCSPSSSNFGDTDLESLLVSVFRQKTFALTLRLDRIDQQFARSFGCERDGSDRVVVGLKQGVGGHRGEDDFTFHITLDGRHEFDLKTKHGLLNEEIEYCGAGKQVNIQISAKEKDIFFDDEYKPESGIVFTRSGDSTQSQSIRFKRKTYFGQVFTDKVSTAVVTLRE